MSRLARWRRCVTPLAVALLVASSCTSEEGTSAPPDESADVEVLEAPEVTDGSYVARVTRVTHGVPHIVAGDWGSLGFGQGWAMAEDHLCTLADQAVKLRGERSSWFGAGDDGEHLASDVAYRSLGLVARGEARLAQLPPEARDLVEGYAAGTDAWLRDVGTSSLPGWCGGEPWVGALTPAEVMAIDADLSMLGSGRQLVEGLAAAQPPGADGTVSPAPPIGPGFGLAEGTSAWALGEQVTGGGGMLAVDLHLPWEGELRLWEQHLTIPGELDVHGVGFLGTPMVQTGFTDEVAWAQVPADGVRATAHRLELVPGDPTTYLRDGVPTAMVPTTHAIEVAGEDAPVEVTTWSTDLGPVVSVPGGAWTTGQAVALADASLASDGLLLASMAMARAGDLDSLQVALEEVGTPWSDVVAATADGTAWYASAAATPAVDAAVEASWLEERQAVPEVGALAEAGVALVGSDAAATAWTGAGTEGLVAVSSQPDRRSDRHLAATGGHWLVDPDRPLTGWGPFVGDEGAPLGVSDRQGIRVLAGLVAETEGDDIMDPALVERFLLSDESLTGELLADEAVARCRQTDSVRVRAGTDADGEVVWPSQVVDVTDSCEALALWLLAYDVEDRGALLWRETLHRLVGGGPDGVVPDDSALWAEPFDPDDPLDTPTGLAPAPGTGPDPLVVALAEATLALEAAGLGPDAAVREAQHTMRGVEQIAVHGGWGLDGTVAGAQFARWSSSLEPGMERGDPVEAEATLTDRGAPVNLGSALAWLVVLDDDGASADGLLVYGQSGDPLSPYFADQTYRYGDEAWRPVRASDEDVASSPELTTAVVSAERGRPSAPVPG